MTLDVRQLRFFVAVANAGSVNRAAGELNIAQSALSRRIQQLELDLGMALFVRSRMGIRLSQAGEMLLGRALPLLGQFDRLEQDLALAAGRSRAPLRFGLTGSAASALLDTLVRRFRDRHPTIPLQAVQGSTTRLQQWLLSDELDVAVLTNPKPMKGFKATSLWREGVFVVAAPVFARQNGFDLAELTALPFILTTRSAGVRDMIEACFARLGHRLHVPMEMEAISTVKRMVERGEAFAVLPFASVAEEVAQGRLMIEALGGAHVTRSLVWRVGSTMPKAVMHLRAVLTEVLEEHLADIPDAEPLWT